MRKKPFLITIFVLSLSIGLIRPIPALAVQGWKTAKEQFEKVLLS